MSAISIILLLTLTPCFAFITSPVTFRVPKSHSFCPQVDGPRSVTTSQYLFGGLFGSDDGSEKPDGDDLAKYSKLPTEKYEPLKEYVRLWAKLFEEGEIGLTTPAKVEILDNGAQILFKPKVSAYRSKKEDDDREKGGTGDKGKKSNQKEGGVEVVVEKAADGVTVIARRCEMDEETMIREMSEETILGELQKAIGVWRKENKL